MKRILAMLLAATLTFSGGAALADDSAAADIPGLIEPVGVKLDTAVVTRQDIYNLEYYDAAVVPQVDELAFTVDGVIDTFNVLVGDVVSEGDVLATLDQTELEEQIESLRDRIDYLQTELEYTGKQDKLALQYAQIELERLTAQAEAGEATDEDVKLKQADISILRTTQKQARDAAEFDINSLRTRLTELESGLGKNVITAPYGGRIVYMKSMEKGTSVKAYESIFFIANDDVLSIDCAHISTSDIASATRIYARIGADEYDITAQDIDWQEYIAIALAGGEVRTGFDFADPASLPDTVESGKYAAVFIQSGYVEDALVIPANALYIDAGGRYVYKIDGDTRVRTAVTVGRTTTINVQITDGLEEGDLVYVKE